MPKKTLHDKVKEATSGPKAAEVFMEFFEKIGAFKKKEPQEKRKEEK